MRGNLYNHLMQPTDSEELKKIKLELQYTREAAEKELLRKDSQIKALQQTAEEYKKQAAFFADMVDEYRKKS